MPRSRPADAAWTRSSAPGLERAALELHSLPLFRKLSGMERQASATVTHPVVQLPGDVQANKIDDTLGSPVKIAPAEATTSGWQASGL